MATIRQSIKVNCPLKTVSNQWMQFEEFPRFMVREVRQLDDTHLHWRAGMGGKGEEGAEITEQVPNTQAAWNSTGAPNAEQFQMSPAISEG